MLKQKRSSAAYYGILVLAGALYALLALSRNVWADEAYTLAMLPHSLGEIWRITAADVHPPLYYFLAKLFTLPFGYSQYALRLFSGACYFVILAVGGRELSRLFGKKTGLWFMALYLLFPFSLEHAAEARMYALSSLGVFLCALFAYRAWLENKVWDWVGFTAGGLCAAYSHYFALVAAGVIYGLLLLCCLLRRRRLLKPWLIFSAVTIAAYLPWLKCFIEQLAFKANNEYWIAPITLGSLAEDLMYVLHANGTGIFPLVFGLLGLMFLFLLIREKAAAPLLALAVPALTLGLGVLISALLRPIFIIRYLVPCAPLIIFFVAYGISRIQSKTLYGAAAALLLTAFAGNLLFAVEDILPSPGRFDAAAAAQAEPAQAYLIQAGSDLHISQITSYYDDVTPIYAAETLGAASPYPNIYPLSEFSPAQLQRVAVITDALTPPDLSLLPGFRGEKLGTYQAAFDTIDLWLLEREQ